MARVSVRIDGVASNRPPGGLYATGSEPDPRFSLANERTFLAWMRTSLAMVAGAVAAHAPFVTIPTAVGILISAILLALAACLAVGGWVRWRRTELAMRTGRPLPAFAGSVSIACSTCAIVGLTAYGLIAAAT